MFYLKIEFALQLIFPFLGEVSEDLARVALAAPALNMALRLLAISAETTSTEDLKMEASAEAALEPHQAVNMVLPLATAEFLAANMVPPLIAATSVEFPAANMVLLLAAAALAEFPAANTVLQVNNTMLHLNNTVLPQLLLLMPHQLNTAPLTKEDEEAEMDILETNTM